MSSIVKLIKVDKTYASDHVSFRALKNINLEIRRGEFLAIMGPSGSGKSTLMHIIGLLDTPTSGSYILDGENTAHLREDTQALLRNKKIGFVFQQFNLLGRTSALKNVALPLLYSGIPQRIREEKAWQALKQIGLEDKKDSFPNQLSGGQQQKVAIARALVNNPDIILADEPTGNLDTKSGNEVMKILDSLNKNGKTVVLITHEQTIAKHAKKIVKIRDGEIT